MSSMYRNVTGPTENCGDGACQPDQQSDHQQDCCTHGGPHAGHRLEARAAVRNGRGNGALRKVGAVQEGVLRKSFYRNGEYLDQVLWTIIDEDWAAKAVWENPVRTH